MQLNNRFSARSVPPVTMHLLIINALMWLASMACLRYGVDLFRWLGLHFWQASDFNIAQFFTYMFLHDTSSFSHILVNMFMLWMLGGVIERTLGAKRYLFYYFTCGLGAALLQELVWQFTLPSIMNDIAAAGMYLPLNDVVSVGASGAVFGIMLAFGMFYPNVNMYVIPFPFPIKAKWLVIGYGLIELFFGVSHIMPGVGHFAHLGGMITGILLILYWKHNGTIRRNDFY